MIIMEVPSSACVANRVVKGVGLEETHYIGSNKKCIANVYLSNNSASALKSLTLTPSPNSNESILRYFIGA